MKALVGAFNQEKALVGAFSVIVKTNYETDGSFYSTNHYVVTAHIRDEVLHRGQQPHVPTTLITIFTAKLKSLVSAKLLSKDNLCFHEVLSSAF